MELSGRGCKISKAHVPPTVLQTEKHVGVNKKRRLVRVSHVSPDMDIVPFNHRLSTLERAVKERVFCVKDKTNPTGYGPPPKPVPGHFGAKMEKFRTRLEKFLP